MSKELSLLDEASTLPAYLQGAPSGVSAELMTAIGSGALNRIGTKGNRFRQVVRGEEVGVFDENYLDVIIVGAAPAVSRRFYKGTYSSSGDNAPPTCYSVDGIVPAPDVHQKQADKCALCPQNIKGSRTTESGAKAKACSYFRRMVVMLAGDREGLLYRVDVTAMGLFGESHAKQQKYALNDYAKALSNRGLDAGQIVTRLSFDTDESVPKLLFQPSRYITEEDALTIRGLDAAEKEQYLEISMKTVDITGENGEDDAPIAAKKDEVMQKPKAKPAPEPTPEPAVEEEDEEDEDAAEEAALKEQLRKMQEKKLAAAAAKANPVAQKTSAPVAQKPSAPVAQKVESKLEVVEVGSDAELNDILGDLGL